MLGLLPEQVGRESRLRRGKPGEQWSEADRAQHQVDCIQLLKRRKCKEDDTGSKSKELKAAETTEGLASFDWACMLFSVVQLLTKSSFKQFVSAGELPLDELPKCLVLCLDWLQTQWHVVWCLRHYFNAMWRQCQILPTEG